ncbi:non-ribosomal peptide synthetase [Dictyobacter arantiisoli]|uniref:Carrier domain-containing protein n=1 Tax=Dictyobacter arantiisoli TaxID=2014874 RepID=A0A5A5TER2_9CHLR|nr:hypothetical protein KDI_36150 [Dictyobacter arantiisoli]
MTLSMVENGSRLEGTLEYDTDLFDASTISRFIQHFCTLLQGILADPEQRLSDLPLLEQQERHQLLIDWNVPQEQNQFSLDICFPQYFHAQVERTPDSVAAIFEGNQLTYQELHRRVNQLGHYLQCMGAGPEIRIGISMERSLELLIGALAILKVGGTYVPLDPSYPLERLRFMLTDVQVSLLLIQERLRDQLPIDDVAHVVCLDADWPDIEQESAENDISDVQMDNAAYIIYTSGSTGRPKGVVNTHRGLINHLCWRQTAYHLDGTDRVLHKTPMSFDVSVWELVWPLMVGGSIVIAKPQGHLDGHYLVKLIQEQQVTTLHFVPSMLRVFLDEPELERSRSLKHVICGGEALTDDLQERFYASQTAQLYNQYGPAEAAIDATFWTCNNTDSQRTVPIGRPIANTQIYILDEQFQPVPFLVTGELYIGGEGLGRGYLNQPALTAERFMPNPFSAIPGARLYRTGDLGRYLADGTIEFLGRRDHQVKLRGFRIELGEIEAILEEHSAVSGVVVMIREEVVGDKRLVAYVVSKIDEKHVLPDELKRYLGERLPDYMVPSIIIVLDAFPLTPNGKVDRQALPSLHITSQLTAIAPRDEWELQLVNIWQDILNVSPISPTDNFFDLGGHSLLTMRLLARIQQQFNQRLPLTTLFQRATIEGLASVLRQKPDLRPRFPLVGIQPHGSRPPFFCVHPVGGSVLVYLNLARHLHSEQPFYGLQAAGLDGEQAPYTDLVEMARYYVDAIRTIQPHGPYLLGGWSIGGAIAFEMGQQLYRQGQDVASVVLIDSSAASYFDQTIRQSGTDASILVNFLQDAGAVFGQDFTLPDLNVLHVPASEQLQFLLEQAHLQNVFPRDIGIQHIKQRLNVFKANTRAIEGYVPQVYPGDITLLRAEEGAQLFSADPTLGWSALVQGQVRIIDVPGDHYTMFASPQVQVLADRLGITLDAAIEHDETFSEVD